VLLVDVSTRIVMIVMGEWL